MKKQNSLAEFFKSKSFYALLCVGALAIIAMSLVGLNQPSDKGGNMVDLNEPIVSDLAGDEFELANNTNNPTSSNIANMPSDNMNAVAKSDEDGFYVGESIPEDVYQNDALISGTDSSNQLNVDVATEGPISNDVVSQAQVAEPAKEVMTVDALHFDDESVLTWPVVGEIVSKFGRQLDPTTKSSRVNEGIAILATVGDAVKAAANGIVTNISEDDRTGVTMTVSVGNGYSIVYGQLKDVTVKVGDYVEEGKVLASVAERTKFYSMQGDNVYLQVIKDEVAVDPVLYLSDEQ